SLALSCGRARRGADPDRLSSSVAAARCAGGGRLRARLVEREASPRRRDLWPGRWTPVRSRRRRRMVRPPWRRSEHVAAARGVEVVPRRRIPIRASLEADGGRADALHPPMQRGGAMSLRVLHAPAEIAGQASILARALRQPGVDAHSRAYNPGFPQYTPDEMRPYDALPVLPRYAGYLSSFLRHAGRYDVYPFHLGPPPVPPHN